MSDEHKPALDKARKVLLGSAALAAAVRVEIIDDNPGEIDRVTILGVPVFAREPETRRPRVLGIVFPRWLRGPRR